MKTVLLAAALTLGAAALVPTAASAQVGFNIVVNEPPPPLRAERTPRARRGYIWVPGHWNWRANAQRYVWVPGTYMRARTGYYYAEPRWVQRDGRWMMEGGRWNRGSRDRDGDGIPNRYDNDRNGNGIPNRMEGRGDKDRDGVPNRVDRDRDGDGVPNRVDNRPDNPRR